MKTILIEVGAVLAALLVVFFVGHHMGARGVQMDWDADKLVRSTATTGAIVKRTQENSAEAVHQAATNTTITKVKNEELAPVVQRIHGDRVRVGTGSCGPAAATEAPGAGGGNGTDPPGRLVREDVERDTRALTEAVEQDLATGRACQAFVRENGLAP